MGMGWGLHGFALEFSDIAMVFMGCTLNSQRRALSNTIMNH
jgi:hypothetical protein